MKSNRLYILIVCAAMTLFAVVFNFRPRPIYSALERRELAQRPEFTWQGLWSGQLAEDISHWYSDTEPMRDPLMSFSQMLKGWLRMSVSEEEIRIQTKTQPLPASDESLDGDEWDDANHPLQEEVEGESVEEDGLAKLADAGVIVVGSGPNVRALMAYGGSARSGMAFARVCRTYQQRLGAMGVQVYAMPVPLASEFYIPEKARRFTRPQRPTVDGIFAALGDSVKAVDAYAALQQHTDEPIYLRTDHHWAPRGAYYAAEAFARVARVPFKKLDTYTEHVIHRYVGTMYGYSKDIAVKNAPEDFVYYTPTGVTYNTFFTPYQVDSEMHITHVGRRVRGPFFAHYNNGSPMAYCTFMGGDMKITEVYTSTPSQRRLLIVKDSYGNAVPGYLFHSFNEVHVVDFRYFHRNLTQYVEEHKITDLLFAFNIFNVSSSSVARRCIRLLTQTGGVWQAPASSDSVASVAHVISATDSLPAAQVTSEDKITVEQPSDSTVTE